MRRPGDGIFKEAYNTANGITPERQEADSCAGLCGGRANHAQLELAAESPTEVCDHGEYGQVIRRLEVEMKAAAKKLEFEGGGLRNRIRSLKLKVLEVAQWDVATGTR